MVNVGHETPEMFSAVSQFLPSKAGCNKTSIHRSAFNSTDSVQARDKASCGMFIADPLNFTTLD